MWRVSDVGAMNWAMIPSIRPCSDKLGWAKVKGPSAEEGALPSRVGESIWNELGLVVIGFILIQAIYSVIAFHPIDAESLVKIPHFFRPTGQYRLAIVVILLKVLVVSAPLTIIVGGLSTMLFSGQLNPFGAAVYVIVCGTIYIAFLTYVISDHEGAQRLSDAMMKAHGSLWENAGSVITYFVDQYGFVLSAESTLLGVYVGYRLAS
jgi:hypothetical protein